MCYGLAHTDPHSFVVDKGMYIMPIVQSAHAQCVFAVAKVLRDLGISEARLQNSLIEVWNKTDLLPSDNAEAAVPGRQAKIGQSQKGGGNTLGTDSSTNH